MTKAFVLYHSPGARSGRTKMMLDLIGAEYTLVEVDIRANENRRAEYLAINPFGVVPTLVHGDRVILESAAQLMYLADHFPECGLAPPLGDERRATYFELFVLAPATMEPLVIRAWRNPNAPESKKTIREALGLWADRFDGPFFLGAEMSALDVFVHWSLRFFDAQALAEYPDLAAYRTRMDGRLDWNGY
ncbi:MAG: glutathione S-transferase family protein [Myxococcota bacterium]